MWQRYYLPVIASVVVASIALHCGHQQIKEEHTEAEITGEELAHGMCGSCHLFPEPALLDKASWQDYMLPRMGYFLGIYPDSVSRSSLIEDGPAEQRILAASVFPEHRLIDSASWEKIRQYYLGNAPDTLTAAPALNIQETEQFRAIRPAFQLKPPSSTFISLNEREDRLYLGDAFTGQLYAFDNALQLLGAAKTTETPVWMSETPEDVIITVMGSFSPTDAPSGMVIALPKSGQGDARRLITDLQRPVHHSIADLDADGLEDLIVCEFAKWTGSLSWWKNKGKEGYERHVLKASPGATKAYTRDWNNDGHMDVVALFGQGNEGIWVYMNQGDGSFKEEEVLRFPPSWGSAYFSLVDLDGDGDEDMVYCAGDNADFGPVLRPYHGIRLYFNEGNHVFSEPVFIPLNGAYAAIPKDYDLDGDMDLAAISFFPDFEHNPKEGFVYLENTGGWNFQASTFPEVGAGRWIVMDAGDVDHDGDIDLVLASLTFEVIGRPDLVQQWAERGIPFVVLENLER